MADKNKHPITTYPVQIVGRHVDITEAMKNYALEKLSKIDKFGGRVMEATIIMDVQKLDHLVEYILLVNNTKITVKGHSTNMYASIDEAIDRLEAKLARYMRRLHMHNAKSVREVEMQVAVLAAPVDPLTDINDQIEEESFRKVEEELTPHKVVSKDTMPLRILTLDEAVMKIELSGDHFMVYRSEEDHRIKLIYKREDGNLGVVEVESAGEQL